jgi:hypothetical protein
MMKTADSTDRQDIGRSGRAWLNGPACRRRLVQSDVGSVVVIIGQIITTKPT